MITYQILKNKPAVFRSFTGMNLVAFQKLLPAFERAYEADLGQRDRTRRVKRQRERGGGRHSVLKDREDKLLFILFYFKSYPLQEVQGYLFGMSQAWAWLHRLSPVVHRALGYEKQLPARQAHDMAQALKMCPTLEFIIDGTERPIRRPKDKARQTENYSGKKRRHPLKNIIVTEKSTKKVKALGSTCEGKKHDKTLAAKQALPFPKGSKVWKDLGFQGYEPEGTTTYQPTKKPKGKELTAEQKQRNQEISKERIGVEHSIGGVKVFAIVHSVYRNFRKGFEDLIMETACGLHNWRLDFRLTA